MSRSGRWGRRSGDDSGQITVFVTVVMAGLLAVAGLVADGGAVLAAHQEATTEAFEAARAAAQELAVGELRSSGTLAVDPVRAQAAVAAYMAATGHTATVSVAGDEVTVTVRYSQPLVILGAFGLGPVGVAGSSTVVAYRSVNGAPG